MGCLHALCCALRLISDHSFLKSVRNSADQWPPLQEKLGAEAPAGVDVETLFARAIETKLFEDKNAVDEIAILVEARASYHRREVDSSRESPCSRWSAQLLTDPGRKVPVGSALDNADIIDVVVHVLREGIERTRAAKKGGDQQMRLEKYLIRMVSS